MNEYEDQHRNLVKRRDEQFEEIKILRKGNMNMHKEHNRLQLIIKESYKQEEMNQEKLTKTVGEKDKIIEELNVNLKHLDDKIIKKEEQITAMRKTIENQELEISKYDENFKEISSESKALIQALAKELGEENGEATTMHDSHVDGAIVSVLKSRRCSLQDDFKSFSKHVLTPVWTEEGKEMELCSQTTDLSINKLQNQLQDNFHRITSEYKETLSHVQQTENNIENIQHRTIELETTLLGSQNEKSKRKKDVDLERQFQELKQKHNETMKENSIIKEDLIKWTNECDRITTEHTKLKVQYEDRIKELYEEKEEANLKLQNLKIDIKKRLEISYREKTVLEKQMENLKEKYPNTGSKNCKKIAEIHSQDIHTLTKKDDIALVTAENTSEQKERTNELLTSWGKEKKQLIEKTKALKNQLSEQGKLIGCLVEEGLNLQKETRYANKDLETENATSWFPEKNMELLSSNM